jgi:hypothetical protein
MKLPTLNIFNMLKGANNAAPLSPIPKAVKE